MTMEYLSGRSLQKVLHTNGVAGVMFGGIMMQWIDVCAGVAAMRHASGAVLTASIDRLDFMSPVQVGEIVVLQAQVNYTSRTSMEVGCRVETEDMHSRTRRYVTKACLTFVAVDGSVVVGCVAEGIVAEDVPCPGTEVGAH